MKGKNRSIERIFVLQSPQGDPREVRAQFKSLHSEELVALVTDLETICDLGSYIPFQVVKIFSSEEDLRYAIKQIEDWADDLFYASRDEKKEDLIRQIFKLEPPDGTVELDHEKVIQNLSVAELAMWKTDIEFVKECCPTFTRRIDAFASVALLRKGLESTHEQAERIRRGMADERGEDYGAVRAARFS